jgi:MarR family transcriptional regulator, lower aerobic nicotinate degradation pathway regulator
MVGGSYHDAMTHPESHAFPEPLLAFPSFLMFQLVREARRIIGTLDDGGLRLPHVGVLSCLAEFGPAAQKDISTRLRIDASDLVSVLDDLERAGLVRRDRDRRDRRRYAVTMTTAGTDALAHRMAATKVLDERLLEPLTEPERSQLHHLLLRAYAHHDPDRLPAVDR